jgi:alanine racemase
MDNTSWIELDHQALKKNIRYLKKRIGPQCVFTSVIKGNAYGHGIEQYLPLAEDSGINHFAVYDAYEAYRASQVKKPETALIVLGMLDDSQLEWVISNDIAFFVFTPERLTAAIGCARRLKKRAKIHLELETGMNRTGLEAQDFPQVISCIKQNSRYLCLCGICTHYAGAESISNYLRVMNQNKLFLEYCRMFKKAGINAIRHSACSAAALTYPNTIMDMARFGIAQYGIWPSMETKMHNLLSGDSHFLRDPLKSVLSWKTRVMSVKSVLPGNFVNYGNAYLATGKMRLATIPVGYHHGYSRSLSNAGHVIIKGRKADVVGMVNMNMFMVDASRVPDVRTGDEVVLIGKQGDLSISVSSFSELTKMVNYELLARLPQQIPRLVV